LYKLHIAGADTHMTSSLCVQCPHAAAGCCVAPPRYAWADIARVVAHGGALWLMDAIARGAVIPFREGLTLRRVKARVRAEPTSPRVAKCVFHDGGRGCTIDAMQRPATCNYYVCESVFESARQSNGSAAEAAGRAAHADMVTTYTAWDTHLNEYVAQLYPEGPPWSLDFLQKLEEEWRAIQAQ
jgi:hypothetical protein